MFPMQFRFLGVAAIICSFMISGCGGDNYKEGNNSSYSVSGSVTGLAAGTSVTLQNNSEKLTLSNNGNFTFETPASHDDSYVVTVTEHPSHPTQTCSVNNGKGDISEADITNVSVVCAANTHTISGTIVGLTGTGLILQNNGTDDLAIAADGTFSFTTPVASGANYGVSVLTQPSDPRQVCTVNSGTGKVTYTNISNVTVSCTTYSHTVSGTVSGLAGAGMVLQNNGGDDLNIPANGRFTFATPVASGMTYTVTVKNQPSAPMQTCTVDNYTGTVTNEDIANVSVICSTNSYFIGGSVSGLSAAGLVLENNGADFLSISINGTFAFATPVVSGATYDIQVNTQPSGQICVVNSGTGTVGSGDVTNANVTCALVNANVGSFSITGNLKYGRSAQTSTLLPNGKVLAAGGWLTQTAELYDPAAGSWTYTGSLSGARYGHTATLLPNGVVLVAGGSTWSSGGAINIAPAELYNPATGSWTTTGSMITPRENPTATLLTNGKVLLAGGTISGGAITSSTELYDPSTGTWTSTGNMSSGGHYKATATLLPNGKVLIAGGYPSGVNAELYDPATGLWASTGSMKKARRHHIAALLSNGKVLVAGGVLWDGITETRTNTAELYDPTTGSWTATGSMTSPRYAHSGASLANGKVLVSGGSPDGQVILSTAEIYDPATGAWSNTGDMVYGRVAHTTTVLNDSKVLLVGNEGWPAQGTSELYQ